MSSTENSGMSHHSESVAEKIMGSTFDGCASVALLIG